MNLKAIIAATAMMAMRTAVTPVRSFREEA